MKAASFLRSGQAGQLFATSGPDIGRPVPKTVVADVYGDHLRRASPLQLKGVEAVVGPDIEAALASDIGPGHPIR